MSWNGSDQSGRATSTKSPDSRPRGRDCPNRVANGRKPSTVPLFSTPIFYIPLSLLLLALLGGAAYYFLRQPSNPPTLQPSNPSKPTQIASVAPSTPAHTNAAPVAAPEPPNPNEETYVDKNGRKRYKIGNGAVYDPTRPVRKLNVFRDKDGNRRNHSKYCIFETRAENEIARLISMKPGSTMFGQRRYDEDFEAEWRESLKTPIQVLPTDTPYEARLKENVMQVNSEIQERMAKGEKFADILGEARDELRRLASYKRDLQKQISTIVEEHPEYTQKEVDELVAAANTMLTEKGVSKISSGHFTAANLSMDVEEARERKASREARQSESVNQGEK